MEVRPGETVAMIGANGAGKSTIMRAVSGLLRPVSGDILLDNRNVARLEAHRIAASGLALVPEGRQVFPELTVYDNLALGAIRAPMPTTRRKSRRCSSDFQGCATDSMAAPDCFPAASSRCFRLRAD